MLFQTSRADLDLHPSFVRLRDDPKLAPARMLMDDAFSQFPDRDRNFVEQFQTTGFDNRTFELYVSELLRSEQFVLSGTEPQPDFQASKDRVSLIIECTTANPTDTGQGARMDPYRPMNERDSSLLDIKERSHNEIPIRIGGALYSKMTKGVRLGDQRVKYWDLPHCQGKPFVLAVQTFHEDGSLSFSDAGVAEYLYGLRHTPDWDKEGNLIINSESLSEHVRKSDGKRIPSGFFSQPDSEHISGVLWSNAGTVPKFNRIALAGPYATNDVLALRYGNYYDWDPNAHAPLPFVYIIGSDNAPEETWGQEAVFFHNPNALMPIAEGLFDNVSEASVDPKGAYSVKSNKDFFPFMSMTSFFAGHKRIEEANSAGDFWYQVLTNAYKVASRKVGNPLWT